MRVSRGHVPRVKTQLQGNVPFEHGIGLVGEPIFPDTMTFHEWQKTGVEFTPAVQWQEDEVPMKTYTNYNTLSSRRKLINGVINAPTFFGDSLMHEEPVESVRQWVARGMTPYHPGLEEQAREETALKLAFMGSLLNREVPESTGGLQFKP